MAIEKRGDKTAWQSVVCMVSDKRTALIKLPQLGGCDDHSPAQISELQIMQDRSGKTDRNQHNVNG